MKLMSKVLGGT
jgi:hypothetical protein